MVRERAVCTLWVKPAPCLRIVLRDKAKKHRPLDFSALEEERPADETAAAQQEAAPEAAPDFDLAIEDDPSLGAPPLTVADANPLTITPDDRPAAAAPTRRAVGKTADAGSGTAVYGAATAVSALWALAPIAYAIGYRQGVAPLQNDPFALAVFALLAIGPAAFVWVAAYMIRQSMKLSAEARRTRELAELMLTPAAMAAAGAADAVAAVRAQIESAALMASDARDRMLTLRETLAQETGGLAEATAGSARTTVELAGSVAREREALEAISAALDTQSAAITDAIGRQARMVAEASDLAETQLREAEAALAARAADLAGAAGSAMDAARTGADDVARQAAKLEAVGELVTAQLRTVDDGLNQQRHSITALAETLRAEHEDFAAQAETRAAQIADLTTHARVGANDVGETAARSAEALSGLIAAAAEQLGQISRAAETEREGLGQEVQRSLEAITRAAQTEREGLNQDVQRSFDVIREAAQSDREDLADELHQVVESLNAAAEKARSAAQGHVDIAKSHVDQLNEAAFAAGQRADAVFNARLTEARELIEQSAIIAEQAGARSAQHLDQGVAAARAAVAEVERLLSDVDEKAGSLQGVAAAQIKAVRDAVEQGMGEMLASARRAAEETQAIDAAFQDRIKRNYDRLSEAVSLMSAVSVGTGAVRAASPSTPTPATPTDASSRPEPPPAAEPALVEPVAPPPPAAPPLSELTEEGPRPRLRLTPTATDEDLRTVFDIPEPPPAEDAGWTWKDLLGGLSKTSDAQPAPVVEANADSQAVDYLTSQIAFMGIDPSALLPRARIEEIAAAVQAGDTEGARDVVKRLAPAAIRRLVRKLFSDNTLKAEADKFLARYRDLVAEAAQRDRAGLMIAALLGSDSGRTYLLLDAADGDLA